MSTENVRKIHHRVESENVSRAYTNILDALSTFKANEIDSCILQYITYHHIRYH